ncbi:Hypothetical protein CINCED_3A000256, partial [Cinara cedri]
EIKIQYAALQLDAVIQLCELQTDPLLSTKKIDVYFWKKLSVVKYPLLREFALKMLSMFGTTYI